MRDVDRIIELVRDICPAVDVKQLLWSTPEQMTMDSGISTNLQASFRSK